MPVGLKRPGDDMGVLCAVLDGIDGAGGSCVCRGAGDRESPRFCRRPWSGTLFEEGFMLSEIREIKENKVKGKEIVDKRCRVHEAWLRQL